ncbi:MAG: hypothetical protein AAF297_11125 [Planctomycetota bacterium]
MQLQPGEVERFREVQPMHRNPIIRYLLPVEFFVMTAIFLPLGANASGNDQITLAIVWFCCGVILPLALAFGLQLTTVVTDRRLLTRFRPLGTKSIELDHIDAAEPIKYSPLGDVGGWGIKGSRKFGLVYNVAGEHGVLLNYTKDDKPKKMLIGSDHPGDIAVAIGKPPSPPE